VQKNITRKVVFVICLFDSEQTDTYTVPVQTKSAITDRHLSTCKKVLHHNRAKVRFR